jgi:hypothetical protein
VDLEHAMTDDSRIGTPGTFEFSDPDGVLQFEWIGEADDADDLARLRADQIELEHGGRVVVMQIRRRQVYGWQPIPRHRNAA